MAETVKPGPEATAYQRFMYSELQKIKQENPGLNHKEAFKLAVSRWAQMKAGRNVGR